MLFAVPSLFLLSSSNFQCGNEYGALSDKTLEIRLGFSEPLNIRNLEYEKLFGDLSRLVIDLENIKINQTPVRTK